METLISAKETALRTGWPERRIRQMIARKELRHIRVGNKILLPETAVAEFIRQNMAVPCSSLRQGQATVNAAADRNRG